MNIAILIPELQGGGAERVASIIGNYYVNKGQKVYYFLAKNSGKCAYQIQGKIINTEIVSGAQNIFSLLKEAYIMRKYKKKYKIDVSISFMEEFNYINVLSKRNDFVITRICTILSQRDELKKEFLYKNRLIHFFYNCSDKVVVMTKYAQKEMIEKYGVKKRKIIRIPNPVKTQIFNMKDGNANSKWQYGDNVVVCVGRLEPVKQHNIAIRAFSYVVQRRPDAQLLILGTGSDYNKLKKLISNLQLKDNVQLLGFQKNISYYLRHAKAFLMTSKTEGFPNSMIEAMAEGLPIVSINSPGATAEILGVTSAKEQFADVIYGKYGIVTPYIRHEYLWDYELTGEEKILSKVLIRTLSDNKLRNHYSERAKTRTEIYQLDKVMKQWNQLITGGKNK